MSVFKRADTNVPRHPIKVRPLPEPGESLIEMRNDLAFNEFAYWIVMPLVVGIVAALEWWRWLLPREPTPVLHTVIWLGVCAYAAPKLYAAWKDIRNLVVGIDGEKAVGQQLERDLIPLGYQVFHDIPFPSFNIDHAAIGPAGAFAFETKTASKRTSNPKVSYDGKSVVVAGLKPERDPVIQAKANANQLRQVLYEYAGRDQPTHPVIVYPGWFVEQLVKNPDIWVLNEKMIVAYVNREPRRLSEEDVKVLSSALARYVRNQLDKPTR